MKIPFVDLKIQYYGIKEEIDKAIQSVIEESAFVRGRYVKEFEESFAAKYGIKHCVSVANGTDAIYITLKMLGIGEGDEVITTALSWIATSETITQTGAKPVFVDIDPEYYTIDAKKIEEKITPKTKAIIPVHLYGQAAQIDKIKELCDKYKLFLVEDCAQAHFAQYKGKKVGTFGTVATFSFYPGKNLGAYGDAGAIIIENDELAVKIRMFANHGALKKHDHEIEGVNSRMDGLQAAILSVKLKYIEEWNQRRLAKALSYNERLKQIKEIVIPKIRPEATHIFHLYVIRTARREELKDFLKQQGIDSAIHYPIALPFLKAYRYLDHKPQDFPVAYKYQNEILSLPMYPELPQPSISFIAEQIENFFEQ